MFSDFKHVRLAENSAYSHDTHVKHFYTQAITSHRCRPLIMDAVFPTAASSAECRSSSASAGAAISAPVAASQPTRRSRLQRSERLQSDQSASSTTSNSNSAGNGSYSSWETLVRDSFGHVAWPVKITSWELVTDRAESVPKTRYPILWVRVNVVFACVPRIL